MDFSNSDSSGPPPPPSKAPVIASPYLNFDPTIISPQAEFILPEGAGERRGRFEMAFSEIGAAVFLGGSLGGTYGAFAGLKATQSQVLPTSVKRAQIWNNVTKRGSAWAQTLGVAVLWYGLSGWVLGKVRQVDDELNTVAAGGMAGLIYRSAAGLRSSLLGGAVGLVLSTTYCGLKTYYFYPDRFRFFASKIKNRFGWVK